MDNAYFAPADRSSLTDQCSLMQGTDKCNVQGSGCEGDLGAMTRYKTALAVIRAPNHEWRDVSSKKERLQPVSCLQRAIVETRLDGRIRSKGRSVRIGYTSKRRLGLVLLGVIVLVILGGTGGVGGR